MGFLDGNSEVLESLVAEMYARGLSTRDVDTDQRSCRSRSAAAIHASDYPGRMPSPL